MLLRRSGFLQFCPAPTRVAWYSIFFHLREAVAEYVFSGKACTCKVPFLFLCYIQMQWSVFVSMLCVMHVLSVCLCVCSNWSGISSWEGWTYTKCFYLGAHVWQKLWQSITLPYWRGFEESWLNLVVSQLILWSSFSLLPNFWMSESAPRFLGMWLWISLFPQRHFYSQIDT